MSREQQVATEAARRAGSAIRDVYRRENLAVTHKADDKGPLTEADLRSNEILVEALTAAFPEDGVLSEETADTDARLSRRRTWIIDPLDGTREFTLGMPEFVVSIGLVQDGVPVLGVLYQPIVDELIVGVVGQGCTVNGAAAGVSAHRGVSGARFLVSRNEMEKGWFDAWKDQAHLEPMGSVAYKLGLVAIGRAEATFTPQPRNEWDLCGGVACLLAAGGTASDGQGQPYVFNQKNPLNIGVCGTNGPLHAEVLQMMKGR